MLLQSQCSAGTTSATTCLLSVGALVIDCSLAVGGAWSWLLQFTFPVAGEYGVNGRLYKRKSNYLTMAQCVGTVSMNKAYCSRLLP